MVHGFLIFKQIAISIPNSESKLEDCVVHFFLHFLDQLIIPKKEDFLLQSESTKLENEINFRRGNREFPSLFIENLEMNKFEINSTVSMSDKFYIGLDNSTLKIELDNKKNLLVSPEALANDIISQIIAQTMFNIPHFILHSELFGNISQSYQKAKTEFNQAFSNKSKSI
jgi:hypothetical protein